MATIKKHLKSKPFTIVENDFLNNDDLYFSAKGLFSYMISKPSNWNFTIKSIKSQSRDGQSRVTTALDELKKLGFIHYEKLKNGSGIYHLYENPKDNPKFENPNKAISPSLENPSLENPNLGNSKRISNTILNSNKEISNNKKNKQKNVCVSESSNQNNFSISELEEMIKAKKGINNEPLKANTERKKVAEKKESKELRPLHENSKTIIAMYPKKCPKFTSASKSISTYRLNGSQYSDVVVRLEKLIRSNNGTQAFEYIKSYIKQCVSNKMAIKGLMPLINSIEKGNVSLEEIETESNNSQKMAAPKTPMAKPFS